MYLLVCRPPSAAVLRSSRQLWRDSQPTQTQTRFQEINSWLKIIECTQRQGNHNASEDLHSATSRKNGSDAFTAPVYRPMLNVITRHRSNYDDIVVDDNDDNYGKNVATDVDDENGDD